MNLKNTVRDFLTKGYWARLKKLEELDAPHIIIEKAREFYENPLEQVTSKSLKKFGDIEIHGFQIQTGYGGKVYLRMKLAVGGGSDILLVQSKFASGPQWYIYQQKN